MSLPDKSRVIKPKTPVGLIIGVTLGGIFLLAFIFAATFISHNEIQKAKMTGMVTSKTFTPREEKLISIGKGGFSAKDKKGNFSIMVAVPQKNAPAKDYVVDNLSEQEYNSLKVGDKFDVGPYLEPQ